MVEVIFSYHPGHRPWGSYPRRMLLYLGLNLGLFLPPPPWGLGVLIPIFILGLWSRIDWASWLGALKGFWVFILLPPVLNLGLWGSQDFWPAWGLSWTASGRFLAVLASSHWLTSTTTILEIRQGLAALFRPLGARIGGTLALIGALTLAFLPWMEDQVKRSSEALSLRTSGTGSRKKKVKNLLYLGLPVTVGLLEKARHTADALTLRQNKK